MARLITSVRGPVMQNFMQIPARAASRQMDEINAKIFIAVHIGYLFFRNSFTGQTLQQIFACDSSNDAVSSSGPHQCHQPTGSRETVPEVRHRATGLRHLLSVRSPSRITSLVRSNADLRLDGRLRNRLIRNPKGCTFH